MSTQQICTEIDLMGVLFSVSPYSWKRIFAKIEGHKGWADYLT